MLSMILVARILGSDHYGEVGIILSSIAMFESVAAMGMGITATKHIAEYRQTDTAKIGGIVAVTHISTLIISASLGILVYVVAPWMAIHILEAPSLSRALRIGVAILALNAMTGGNIGILSGFEEYKTLAFINGFLGLITPPLVVGGAYYSGVEGTFTGMACVALVSLMFYWAAVYRRMRADNLVLDYWIKRRELSLLWRFSLPAMLAGILIAPVNWILGAWLIQRDGYAEMGLYSAANQWFSILLFLPGVITSVYLPVFSGAGNAQGGGYRTAVIWKGVKTALWVSLPLAALTAVASPWIMAAYGPDYSGAYPLLAVVAATAAVAATQNMLSNALATMDLMWLHLASNLLWAAINLGAAHGLLGLGYSAMALCWAALLAYAAKLVINLAIIMITMRGESR